MSAELTGGTVTSVKATNIFSPYDIGWAWGLLAIRRGRRDYNRLCHLDGGTWYEDTGERGLTNPSKDGII